MEKREHAINSFYRFPKVSLETEQMRSDCKRLNFHLTAPFIALKPICHLSLISWSLPPLFKASSMPGSSFIWLEVLWSKQWQLSPFYRWVNWGRGIRKSGSIWLLKKKKLFSCWIYAANGEGTQKSQSCPKKEKGSPYLKYNQGFSYWTPREASAHSAVTLPRQACHFTHRQMGGSSLGSRRKAGKSANRYPSQMSTCNW